MAILWLDVFTHAPDLSPTVPGFTLAPGSIRQFFKWDRALRVGQSRAMPSREALWQMLSTGKENLEIHTTARRLALSMNFNLLDEVPKFDGFYSMDLKRNLEVFKQFISPLTRRPG